MAENLSMQCIKQCNGDIIKHNTMRAMTYHISAYRPYAKCDGKPLYADNLDNNSKWHLIKMLSTMHTSHYSYISTNELDFYPQNPFILLIMADLHSPFLSVFNIFCISMLLAYIIAHKTIKSTACVGNKFPYLKADASVSKYALIIGASILQILTHIKVQIRLKYLKRGGPKHIISKDICKYC